ncbi:uncharacterized protein EI97DRAFT_471745 [Westerdykella ornata]|uniref:Uncharacterized protein n=1 Tax=Westerdykella ornata TaxID=318751 RepID=A0A6A6JY24_WESOR|nr:uncharacterized protein EI97DRAFT_471745 [Westerdykella ornata]KAF2280738.1 hypothetical protein EI97DRAFT_471745 [Westerdykella ornata]
MTSLSRSKSRKLRDLKQRLKRFIVRLFPSRIPTISITPATPGTSPAREPTRTESGLQYVKVGDHYMVVDPMNSGQMRRAKAAKEMAERSGEAAKGAGQRAESASASAFLSPDGTLYNLFDVCVVKGGVEFVVDIVDLQPSLCSCTVTHNSVIDHELCMRQRGTKCGTFPPFCHQISRATPRENHTLITFLQSIIAARLNSSIKMSFRETMKTRKAMNQRVKRLLSRGLSSGNRQVEDNKRGIHLGLSVPKIVITPPTRPSTPLAPPSDTEERQQGAEAARLLRAIKISEAEDAEFLWLALS